MEECKILIIGGGVIGCAVAEALSRRWPDVYLAEQSPKMGMATSTRNSGVIHSGIYYPKGSKKAIHCVAGNRLTKEFCVRHKVPHRNCGKVVVAASPSDESSLLALLRNGEGNGVEGLRLLTAAEIGEKEPNVKGHMALDVPSTGICSAEELVHAFARVGRNNGANLINHAKVISLEKKGDTVQVGLRIGEDEHCEEETIDARCVINAGGLFSDEIAGLLGQRPWQIYPVRGEYCEIRGPRADLVRGLVYPMPHKDGLSLGLHFTRTVWGTTLVGPTATYVDDKNNYERGRIAISEFLSDARTMLPELGEGDLQLAYAGLRPKLIPPGVGGFADFIIEHDPQVPQVIHLIGIESPGLTAACSIAEYVATLAANVLN